MAQRNDNRDKWKRRGKIAGGVLVGLVVVVALLFLLGIIGVPDAGVEDNSWGEVDDERIEILTTVWIDNPNPFGIGGDSDVEYEVELAGIHIAEGGATGVGVPSGRGTQTFTTDLRYQQIPPWWSSHLNDGEVSDAVVNATAHTSVGPLSGSPSGTFEREVDTDIEGALDEGFSQFEGTYSGTSTDVRAPDGTAIEPTVEVENVTTRWGEVTENETEILVTARIHNPNAYPIPTPAFTGNLAFNDIPVADWEAGEVELLEAQEGALIPGGETEQRTFLVVMDNGNLPPWFASHVENEEYTRVAVSGQLAMEISGSEVRIPREGEGITCEFDLTTSIFVDQEQGMALEACGTTPIETTTEQLEAAGAVLDLSKTDWWDGLLDGDENNDGGDDGDGDDDGGDDDGVIGARGIAVDSR
ncbi:Water stress and hypersensitive response domain-containing protein [Halobacteriales archaeon QH_2_66_30]|nr:MAG: Water stress and hypersensitive response domain-containing protein [Halobacteriales archaeon QH_2_66_30]